ncbi:MAG: phosphodiester glycosidase family protein [Candidatus Uhrbacteria bacterium]
MRYFLCLLIVFFCWPLFSASASSVAERTSGYILLDVEANGEAWYVYPSNEKRYFLDRPDDAFEIMRGLGLGISNSDLSKIPSSGESSTGDWSMRQRLSGLILLQVEAHGEAWYVYPKDLKRYYLGRPADAFAVMSQLGLGISTSDLAQVPVAGVLDSGDGSVVVSTENATHESKTISTDRGNFSIELVILCRDAFDMITDTAEMSDCSSDCAAKTLAEYVNENNASIGIHGTYFCPPDYADCATKVNTFNSPVYNTATGVMLEEEDLPYQGGPMTAYTEDGDFYFYHPAYEFGLSVEEFENRENEKLMAAIVNYPSLVENGINIISREVLEPAQNNLSTRAGLGFDEEYIYLVVARGASVTDLASIFSVIGVDYAMNLDGGASTALYFNNEYLYGPNRELPNAIVFRQK